MGIFSSIKNAIFGEAKAEELPVEATPTAPVVKDAPVDSPVVTKTDAVQKPVEPVQSTPSQPVDVAAVMDAAVKASGQKLDWRNSIVDMMKALKLDSSLASRKELAEELNYTGDTNDSAKMNVWLHRALMKALAENGGNVPAELKD